MITIVLFTCNRPRYAETTLVSTLNRMHMGEPIWVHIADDGSPPEDTELLRQIAGGYDFVMKATSSNAGGNGYGASYNLATQVTHLEADVILSLEDDWELTRELPIQRLANVLRGDNGIDCIRLGYIGWTQELRGKFVKGEGDSYLLFDPDSPEPHVFAGHPRLETVEFQRRVGPWPEGQDAGTTEFIVSQRREARQGIAWPVDLVHPRGDMFGHIGSVQARTDQKVIAG